MSFRLTPVYDLLLRGTGQLPVGVFHLQLATAAQLCRLHYSPKSITLIKARLKTLVDNGYLQADARRTKKGNGSYYYALGEKGIAYLRELGFDTHDAWRAAKELDKAELHLDHTLELNDVLIAAAHVSQVDDRYWLERFQHERVLKRHPFRVQAGPKAVYTVIPDAFMDFRTRHGGDTLTMPVLVEHDRGTEDQTYFRRRIRAYIQFLKTEGYQNALGAKYVTVAFTTFKGEKRREQMRAWTRAELAVTKEQPQVGLRFSFASLEPPLEPRQVWFESCWYSPYDTNSV